MKYKNIVAGLSLVLLSSLSWAGTGYGKVKSILVTVGAIIFSIESPLNLPGCAVGDGYAIDGSTSDGKNTLALVLSAASQGKPIHVVGRGTCGVTGDRETVLYVTVGY